MNQRASTILYLVKMSILLTLLPILSFGQENLSNKNSSTVSLAQKPCSRLLTDVEGSHRGLIDYIDREITGFERPNLIRHCRRHCTEFGLEAGSLEAYAQLAIEFAFSDNPNNLYLVGPRTGALFIYNPDLNYFMVVNGNGAIETFFKPNVDRHRLASNLEYFFDQYNRY